MKLEDLFAQVKSFLGMGESATVAEAHDGLLKLGSVEKLKEDLKGDLQTEVDGTKTGIEDTKKMVADANTKLDGLVQKVSDLEAKLTASETAIEDAKKTVTALEGKLATASSEIANIKANKPVVEKTGDEGIKTPKVEETEAGIKVISVPEMANLVFPSKSN